MNAILYIAFVLLVLLGVHHFVKARRGLRTGVIEGLVIGYSGKHYSRENDPEAFWMNVYAGFFVATLGAIALLWAILAALMWFMDQHGLGAL